MAHINLPANLPGILGPMTSYPATAKPLMELSEILLAQESPTLKKADREIIASYVSFLNDSQFCSETHAAVADIHSQHPGLSKMVWESPENAPISENMRALLTIAKKVQSAPLTVSTQDIERAKNAGATESDIHDTVLIAATLCMFNRYVDGLAAMTPPRGHSAYQQIGETLATQGYLSK